MRNIVLAFVLILACASMARAAAVYEKKGNVYYKNEGKVLRLTSLGRDREPKLHPQGEWVYFVRSFPGKMIGETYHPARGEVIKDDILHEELWRIKKDGTSASRLYQSAFSAIDGPSGYTVASVENIQFSPIGDKVYFETPEWVTSAGLRVMNPDGSNQKLLGAGNNNKIVLSARTFDDREKSYEGYIVSAQHRYYFYGGSYDWFYLFTPDLTEVAPLGDDVDYFTKMGEIKYTDHSESLIKKN